MKCAVEMVKMGIENAIRIEAEKVAAETVRIHQETIDKEYTIKWCDTYIEELLMKSAKNGNVQPCCYLWMSGKEQTEWTYLMTKSKVQHYANKYCVETERASGRIHMPTLKAYLEQNCYTMRYCMSKDYWDYGYGRCFGTEWLVIASPSCVE